MEDMEIGFKSTFLQEILSNLSASEVKVEEVQVMAWERFKKDKWYIGYSKMLKKFLINHAPMWEALFIIENWIDGYAHKVHPILFAAIGAIPCTL
jgi:hypothetical protein